MSHTPGPLRINGDTIMLGRRNIGRAFVTAETDASTTLANARLWGTAPDLLEALQECTEVIFGNSIADKRTADAYNNANRLIAKATGGAE